CLHGFVGRLVACRGAQVCQRALGASEQTLVHLFVWLDMRGKDSAGLFPRGTSGREPVLNHPLGEGLGNDWGSVMKTQYRFGFGDIRRADGRSVTIDQRAWAGVTIEEVLEQFAVACVTLYAFDIVFENALQHLAVGRHVVAAEQRQWLQAQLLALVNGPGKDAYGR